MTDAIARIIFIGFFICAFPLGWWVSSAIGDRSVYAYVRDRVLHR